MKGDFRLCGMAMQVNGSLVVKTLAKYEFSDVLYAFALRLIMRCILR